MVRLEIVLLGSQETGACLGEREDDVAEMSDSYWESESFGMDCLLERVYVRAGETQALDLVV